MAGKGVRFAGLEDEEAKEAEKETVQSHSVDISEVDILLKKEEENPSGEAIEMDSVDFDKVTGTSTPISEDSPSLPAKLGTTADDSSHPLVADASSDTSMEHKDREEVIENRNLDATTPDTPSSSDVVEEEESLGGHQNTNIQESLAQVDSTRQS